jgi:ubiquinone/menaquinone biosynthesis C-methylase UbiE
MTGDCNPWLEIPADDYEGHMTQVGQLQALDRILAEVLAEVRPARLALPGCTTGNGLEHVDSSVTELVLGVDLNPLYLRTLQRRFGALHGLHLVLADLRRFSVRPASFDLVHAALLLEYVDPAVALPEMARWLRPGGALSVVLQLPSAESAPVSETPYQSLKALALVMRLVASEELERIATGCGLSEERSWRVPLPRGKAFWVGLFRLSSGCGRATFTA